MNDAVLQHLHPERVEVETYRAEQRFSQQWVVATLRLMVHVVGEGRPLEEVSTATANA